MEQDCLRDLALHDKSEQAASRLQQQVVVLGEKEGYELLLKVVFHDFTLHVYRRRSV